MNTTDKLREAAQQAERDAFEAAYTMAYPFSASAPGKFYRDQDGYADVFVTVGWRMWQAAQPQQDAQAVPQGWRELLQQSKENCRYNHGHSSLADWIYASIEDLFARSIAAPTPQAQQGTRRLPTLPFAVFDEFGKGCEDRIDDYFSAALAKQDAQVVPQGWHEFLKEIEWANSGHGENGDGEAYCVCCEAWQHEGHQPGCKFFAMLNASTAPEQRVMLTLDEIDEVWSSIAGHSIYAEYQMEIARAMIEAYERKNGIK